MISLFVTMTYLQETMKIESNVNNCLRRWVAGGGGMGCKLRRKLRRRLAFHNWKSRKSERFLNYIRHTEIKSHAILD